MSKQILCLLLKQLQLGEEFFPQTRLFLFRIFKIGLVADIPESLDLTHHDVKAIPFDARTIVLVIFSSKQTCV